MLFRLVILGGASLLVCGAAHADQFTWGGHSETAYDKAMLAADSIAERAASRYRYTAQGLATRAVRHYEEAARLRPKEAEPHYRAALTLYTFFIRPERSTPPPDIAAKAIKHWTEFERLAPLDPRLGSALFHRSLAHTQMATDAQFRAAIRVYEKLLAIEEDPNATYLYNKAELHMMLGHLDDAIELYELALQRTSQPEYGYGLAVALDRDRQGVRALQVMRKYVYGDRLKTLGNSSNIFFVPPGEKHYYLGLGFEAEGKYQQALRSFTLFVESGAHPRFHPRAREHLAKLREKLRGSR